MTKLCAVPAARFTGVLGVPVNALVAGLVVWYAKPAVTLVTGAIVQPAAVAGPAFIRVAKAVAVLPSWTDRLDGSTAAARATGGGEHAVRLAPLPQHKSNATPATGPDGFEVALPRGSISAIDWLAVSPGVAPLTRSAKRVVEPKLASGSSIPRAVAGASRIHSAEPSEDA